MPNAAINALTAPDEYTAQGTIETHRDLDHVNIDVSNQPIYWQISEYTPPQASNASDWTQEVYMVPGSRTLDRANMTGVRVRAAVPAGSLPPSTPQALVTVEAIFG